MSILQTIYDNDLIGKPLFIEDFVSDKLSYNSVKTLLARYVKEGIVKRCSQGVYFIPKKGIIGEIPLSFEEIIEKKYIRNENEIFGYKTGLGLLNDIGLSTQVPNIIEIITNNENCIKRKIIIGKRKAILRKTNIEINKENVLYLQFLDIFKFADLEMIVNNKKLIIDYFKNNHLDFQILKDLEKKIPMKTRKKLRRSEIYDELAQRCRSI